MTTTTTPTTAQAITIQYDHLKAFDASAQTPQNQALIDCVGRAFGSSPDCLGLIAVQGVPNFVNQRQRLLRLAHALANLPKSELETCERADTLYSVGWSHGREQMAEGRPDTSKGSYYANPWTDSLVDVLCQREPEKATYWKEQEKLHPECYADNIWPSEVALPMFRQAFMELGQLMGETGQLLTAVCDAYCKQEKGIDLGLQKTLTQSMNAKGRLLHYFSPVPEDSGEEKKDDTAGWCGWHNDHVSIRRGTVSSKMPFHRYDPSLNRLFPPHFRSFTGLSHMPGSRHVFGREWKPNGESRSRTRRTVDPSTKWYAVQGRLTDSLRCVSNWGNLANSIRRGASSYATRRATASERPGGDARVVCRLFGTRIRRTAQRSSRKDGGRLSRDRHQIATYRGSFAKAMESWSKMG
mmetsp:Transcript_27183/g.62717  ORF Transcript_27183/g.62717 Transcript_27183/m.62717 type:complete len:411 (+) Transcript_27183:299-1531(+)